MRPEPMFDSAMRRARTIALLLASLTVLPACIDRSVSVDIDNVGHHTDVTRGHGVPAREGNEVVLHYTVKLPDGKVIIDTRAKGKAHRFRIGDDTVIPGMDQAVRGMRQGGVREVVMPPIAHYGRQGYGNVVPPDTHLHFRIEMVQLRF